jgi:dihydroflavonol-4-reductase
MTYVVTGASGFIGAAVARRLAAAGKPIRVVIRKTSPRRNLEGLDAEVFLADITDRGSLSRAFQGATAVFHVAADYRLWAREPGPMFLANVDGTRNVMFAALEAGAKRVVYTSSVATLGINKDGSPADENTPSDFDMMIGPYKQSKFLAEAEVRRLVSEEGLPAIIVNPSTPVGPGDIRPTPTGRLVLEAAAGKMPAFVETGLNIVHVDDVAEGHVLALEHGTVGERYILGGENMTLRDILIEIDLITGRDGPKIRIPHGVVLPIAYLVEAWARLTGGDDPFISVDGAKLARKKMFFLGDKARRELNYSTRSSRQAFRDAVAWFRAEGYLV